MNRPGQIALAPMEGLADDVMRAVLSRVGGYDWCVSEFIRVTGTPLPGRFFRRVAPELQHDSRTEAGTPLRVQLLGSDPASMAENAARAAALCPFGIDLNFGCPAPTVNRHRGGAALLDEPELLHAITAAVRTAVPAGIPVTAKMRLGIRDTDRALDCARALADGGAAELVIHARTRDDWYRPPARWEWIGRIREAVRAKVIANGEIWTVDDWRRCREITGCDDVMLGRGAVADPLLALRLRGQSSGQLGGVGEEGGDGDWHDLHGVILDFWTRVQRKLADRHSPGRLKHWLSLMRRSYPQAEALYLEVRPLSQPAAITAVLARHLSGDFGRAA